MKKNTYRLSALAMAVMLFAGCGTVHEADAGSQQGTGQETGMQADYADSAEQEPDQDNLTAEDQENAEDSQDVSEEELSDETVYGDATQEPDESPATGYMVGDHERTLDGIKVYLSTLSDQPAAFAKAGGLALNWNDVTGMRNLIAFEERYAAGEEAEIAVMQYTDEGDPVLDYFYHDGTEIWYVRDNSRDKWRGSEEYWEARYPFFLCFTQKAEERDRMHSLVLSKKDGLTYDECTQMFFEGGSGDETPAVMFVVSFFYTDADL